MKKPWQAQFKKSAKTRRTLDGVTFDSIGEMQCYAKLEQRQKKGEIRNLQRQVSYPLMFADGDAVKTPTGRIMKYTADFVYAEDNGTCWSEVIADYKGYMDKVAQMRIAIFEAIYKKKVLILKK